MERLEKQRKDLDSSHCQVFSPLIRLCVGLEYKPYVVSSKGPSLLSVSVEVAQATARVFRDRW